MPDKRTATSLMLIVAAAVLGYLLVTLPPTLIDGYARAKSLHAVWGTIYLIAVGLGLLLLISLFGWFALRLWRNSRRKAAWRDRRSRDPGGLSRRDRQREIDENLAAGEQWVKTAQVDPRVRQEIRDSLRALEAKRVHQKLEIVAFGSISSGKSSLLNALAGEEVFRTDVVGGTTLARNEIPWPGCDRVILADTPGLAEVGGEERARLAAEVARDADLVLFVVDGPLKAYEVELLRALGNMEKRIVVCLNKQDWFRDSDRDELVAQIARQVEPWVASADVVPTRARPAARRRVRVDSTGREMDELVPTEPDISSLAERMLEIVERDGRDLLLANLLLQSRGLMDEAQRRVMASLDRRAEEIIRRTMWASGSAVAINPFPLLDLAGGSAITVKMVLDLARVYRQNVDADTVINLLAQLGKNLIAMLGVTAATPVISSAVATSLKTVPGIGTVAGGLLQGLVQAVVTLWIGRVFVAYFKHEMRPPEGGLVELAREKWREVTRPEQLRKLIQMGLRFGGGKPDDARTEPLDADRSQGSDSPQLRR
ncbi:MAG: YcjF family protein [Pirellulales bacterium]